MTVSNSGIAINICLPGTNQHLSPVTSCCRWLIFSKLVTPLKKPGKMAVPNLSRRSLKPDEGRITCSTIPNRKRQDYASGHLDADYLGQLAIAITPNVHYPPPTLSIQYLARPSDFLRPQTHKSLAWVNTKLEPRAQRSNKVLCTHLARSIIITYYGALPRQYVRRLRHPLLRYAELFSLHLSPARAY